MTIRHWFVLLLGGIAWIGIVLADTRLEPGPEPQAGPQKRTIYYADLGRNRIYEVKADFKASGAVALKKGKQIKGFKRPWGTAIDPDGEFLLVTNSKGNNVSRVDLATRKTTAVIPVGKSPRGIAITPDGEYAFVANFKSNSVSVIDTMTNAVINSFKVGKRPLLVTMSLNGAKAWVTNTKGDSISTIKVQNAVATLAPTAAEVIKTRKRKGSCDVSGGIATATFPGPSGFSFLNWTCAGTSPSASGFVDTLALNTERLGTPQPNRQSESESNKSGGGPDRISSNRDNSERATQRAGKEVDPASFPIPGAPPNASATRISRAPSYIGSGGFCTSDSQVISFTPSGTKGTSHDSDRAFVWHFSSGPAVEIASGATFGPVFGGGGGTIFVHPVCADGCSAAQIASGTKTLALKRGKNVQSAAMIPLSFGPTC